MSLTNSREGSDKGAVRFVPLPSSQANATATSQSAEKFSGEEAIQTRYYEQTAGSYDQQHVDIEDEHGIAAKYVSLFVSALGAESVLDVGCGTGRGLRHFIGRHPTLRVMGIEPVQAMISEAVKNGLPQELILQGSGDKLPFDDRSFDIVCAFGVLHHVRRPDRVVSEMARVARKAVFVSDTNRFGHGRWPLRFVKLGLAALGLWGSVDFLKTRGKGYRISSGDGLSYSYSVFDSLENLSKTMPYVFTIPTKQNRPAGFGHPLVTASHALVCALKELPE